MAGVQVMKPKLKSHKGNPSQSSQEDLRLFNDTNKIPVKEILLAYIDDLQKLLPHTLYSVADSARDKETIVRRLDHEGLAFATLTLPLLSAGLFQYLETGLVCYPSYKLKKDTGHPVFLQGLFRLAYRSCEHQTRAIQFIYQISVMFKKLKGPYPDSVLRKQLSDFVVVDRELGELNIFTSHNLPLLQQARANITELFRDFNLDSIDVLPRPGPGSTNTKVEKHMRYRPHTLYTQIDTVLPYYDYFLVNGYDIVHQTKLYQALYNKPVKHQRARFKFVHKQVGKARGICLEENETQYLQQAFKRAIYSYIQNHPITSGKVCFDDQSVNASLALLASIDLKNATIDMSEASDRVLRVLVSYLFEETCLHDILMALSTKWIDLPFEVDGISEVEINKFAPMGSGLCFPIMALVHWTLLRSIYQNSEYEESQLNEVYVYGDDIIIPSFMAGSVYTIFPRFGMKINVAKSYYRSHFRESCGIHAYKGVNITPVFVKHIPVSTSLKEAMSCFAVENQMHNLGYSCVASIFRHKLEVLFGSLMYVPEDSSVLGFKRNDVSFPDLAPGKLRLDSWGNPVHRVRVVKPIVKGESPPTEGECYLRYVLTKDMTRDVQERPNDFKIQWVDLPFPALQSCTLRDPVLSDSLDKLVRNQSRDDRDIHEEAKYDFTRFNERFPSLKHQVRQYLQHPLSDRRPPRLVSLGNSSSQRYFACNARIREIGPCVVLRSYLRRRAIH
jgi:hypothetical protein